MIFKIYMIKTRVTGGLYHNHLRNTITMNKSQENQATIVKIKTIYHNRIIYWNLQHKSEVISQNLSSQNQHHPVHKNCF